MNLQINKLSPRESITSIYLSNFYHQQNIAQSVSSKDPYNANRISYPAISMEEFERKFKYNKIGRTNNHLINKEKKFSNSVESKDNEKKIYLPVIKEFKIKNSNKTDKDNGFNDSGYALENSDNKNNLIKSIHNFTSENCENDELSDKIRKSRLNRTNSTLSQSLMFNVSNMNSKINNDIEKEKKRVLLRNLSNNSIFAVHKAKYLLAVKDYKKKSKLAEEEYKEQLIKIKKEKMPKSKNEELFKEYELKFNPNIMKNKLIHEFNFFQNDIHKKSINPTDLRLMKLFKKLKKNEEKKNAITLFDVKRDNLKPSQRSIKNMLRKDKKAELYEQSLLDISDIESDKK